MSHLSTSVITCRSCPGLGQKRLRFSRSRGGRIELERHLQGRLRQADISVFRVRETKMILKLCSRRLLVHRLTECSDCETVESLFVQHPPERIRDISRLRRLRPGGASKAQCFVEVITAFGIQPGEIVCRNRRLRVEFECPSI